eukprot:7178010-Alexandrium_andersonii.AAC.1
MILEGVAAAGLERPRGLRPGGPVLGLGAPGGARGRTRRTRTAAARLEGGSACLLYTSPSPRD